ncbi:MAG TPA: hypothetical protein VFT87_00745 [Candidatus Saccharimonadales bacterium]|nr:hypothetical protein [Candidatus Saccharimonadales bacterium]
MQPPKKRVHIKDLVKQRQQQSNRPRGPRNGPLRYIPRVKGRSTGPLIGLVVFIILVVTVGVKNKSSQEEPAPPPQKPPLAGWGGAPLPNENFNGFSPVQQRNASIIVRVGQEMQMPARAWLVAVMTAMQECRLHNCANNNPEYPEVVRISQSLPHEGEGGDHDSVGLFQQRPIEGGVIKKWGHVKDLMNPAFAAKRFYEELNGVKGWEGLPLTVAAQKVQGSSFPNAYAKHENNATMLVEHVQKYKPA